MLQRPAKQKQWDRSETCWTQCSQGFSACKTLTLPRFNRPFPASRGFRTDKRYYVTGSVTQEEKGSEKVIYFVLYVCVIRFFCTVYVLLKTIVI